MFPRALKDGYFSSFGKCDCEWQTGPAITKAIGAWTLGQWNPGAAHESDVQGAPRRLLICAFRVAPSVGRGGGYGAAAPHHGKYAGPHQVPARASHMRATLKCTRPQNPSISCSNRQNIFAFLCRDIAPARLRQRCE
jgi:hypothetical protein